MSVMLPTKKRVALGMSGGVDSSTSVYLLQQQGYEVVGIHMLLIPEYLQKDMSSMEDAQSVAAQFGIEFHVLDLRNEFENTVIKYFTEAYQRGLTPNPCVYCNKTIKFGLLAKHAMAYDVDLISTGHYIRKVEDATTGKAFFAQALDSKKDQSYFLSLVDPNMVEKCIFPLGDYTKDQVREIADELHLPVAQKKDSQEICFIPNDDYKTFLHQVLPETAFKKGKILDSFGKQLGTHDSIMNYTIGQRKGLGVSLGKPAYVVSINPKLNTVVLGNSEELMNDRLVATQNNFFTDIPYETLIDVEAKIRYRTKPATAKLVRHKNETTDLYFAEEQRAITPGQCVAYYQEERLIGGGWII